MKEKIINIIQGPPESEPIYQLESEYKKLFNDAQKKEFLSIMKFLAQDGTNKEKFISLTVIEFLDKAKECEDVIKRNTNTISINENEKLISPLLTLCAVLSTNWAIDFIRNVIKHFMPKSNEYSYYFDIGLRSMVSTIHWRDVIEELKWAVRNYDDDYIIDLFAYFKWKHGDHELEKLFQLFSNDNSTIKKMDNIEIKINDRYTNNYRKINQR
jgi:hypothetical protein